MVCSAAHVRRLLRGKHPPVPEPPAAVLPDVERGQKVYHFGGQKLAHLPGARKRNREEEPVLASTGGWANLAAKMGSFPTAANNCRTIGQKHAAIVRCGSSSAGQWKWDIHGYF